MSVSNRVLVAFAIAFLFGAPGTTIAQDRLGPHDTAYTSATWGYQVRWYGDEWTVDHESSEKGLDSFWLKDVAGNLAGFDGVPGFGGDAAACLDRLMADVEATPGASDIAVVSDEEGNVQQARNPYWSWVILLARLPINGEPVDNVIYLDCQTLVPGSAVLVRRLVGPAATFEASMDRFGIVQAVLPRSAWEVDTQGHLEPVGGPQNNWPVFYDQVCGGYPRWPEAAYDVAGNERATLTAVDGTPEYSGKRIDPVDAVKVISIENTGNTPLTVDPANFAFVTPEIQPEARQDVAPAVVVWEDTGEAGSRELAPGGLATVRITWPEGVTFPDQGIDRGVYLVFRADGLREDVQLDSIGVPGGCGGGSRPRLRLSR